MINMYIESLRAENDSKIVKEYILSKGINVIQSQITSRGKSTLIGIIDYCFGGKKQNVFPWTQIDENYDAVSIILSINSEKYLIRRSLVKKINKILILSGKDFKEEIKKGLNEFFLDILGIKDSKRMIGEREAIIGMRDYSKLFFIRQMDSENLIGDNMKYTPALAASKIIMGLEKKGYLEMNIDKISKELKKPETYLENLKKDFGTLDYFTESLLMKKEKDLKEIELKINNFQSQLKKESNHKIPLEKEISSIESEIREIKEKILKKENSLIELNLLEKEIEGDKGLINKAEVLNQILENIPTTYCPECESDLKDKEPEKCKVCESILDNENFSFSKFYLINKNTLKEISFERANLVKKKKEYEETLKKYQIKYDSFMIKLSEIESNVISRILQTTNNLIDSKKEALEEIGEIKTKLQNKIIFKKYSNLINDLNKNLKKSREDLEGIKKTSSEKYEEIQELEKGYLKILNKHYNSIDWDSENLFPKIDKKGILANHGGSGSMRILYSVVASIFELSIKNRIKFFPILIIDYFKKHEIESEDLSNFIRKLSESMNMEKKGQVILTGVEISQEIVDLAKEKGKYYFIPQDKYTL